MREREGERERALKGGMRGEKKRRAFKRQEREWREKQGAVQEETGEKMTGNGAVINFLTAKTTAENRSNPLVYLNRSTL